jgi:TerC family integral membrane protein
LSETIFWFFFGAIVVIIFIVDLYVTDKRSGKIKLKNSLMWCGIWISTALIFDVLIYFFLKEGHTRALEFATGYLIEESLSVDNLFVFLLIFSMMNISRENQPHVLKWGILSAIFFRITFILIGVSLINIFEPMIYIFGATLIFASYHIVFGKDKKIDYEKNPLIKFARKFMKFDTDYKGRKFFIKHGRETYATTLFLTLLIIESSDIIFATDSIPAVIAITRDPFIIISSNIFAVLGLRTLYFTLSGAVEIFAYLKYGVGVILLFVGVKMIISNFINISTITSLVIIGCILFLSIILSVISVKIHSRKNTE